jgi:hypothetical protein
MVYDYSSISCVRPIYIPRRSADVLLFKQHSSVMHVYIYRYNAYSLSMYVISKSISAYNQTFIYYIWRPHLLCFALVANKQQRKGTDVAGSLLAPARRDLLFSLFVVVDNNI